MYVTSTMRTHLGDVHLKSIQAWEPKRLMGEEEETKSEWFCGGAAVGTWGTDVCVQSHHISAGTGKRHVSGVELQGIDGA